MGNKPVIEFEVTLVLYKKCDSESLWEGNVKYIQNTCKKKVC